MTTPPAVLKLADVLVSDASENQILYIKNNQIVSSPKGADAYKASEHLTDTAFEQHRQGGDGCGFQSREIFLKATKPNLYERWQAVDALQLAGKIQVADAEDYKRTLEDMAQLELGLHNYFQNDRKVTYAIKFTSLQMRGKPGITTYSEGLTFKVYLNEAREHIEAMGAKIDALKLSQVKFAQVNAPVISAPYAQANLWGLV